ncbi:MAG TPA: hypothetical protein VMS30_03955 [Phycisphaerales bacterium]|nr:hypothetical protein [Phycisphaerales bacterium]
MQRATQAASSTTMPALPTLEPSYTFSFGTDVTGATLSADGQSLLLVRARQSVDVWDALTYWWPELSIILALLTLLIIGLRVSKRPNALGEPHCRRCGYMLRNLQETRCPECGYARAVQHPRYGRRRVWRIALLAAIALAYGAVLRTGHLRTLRPLFFDWFDWPTDALNDRAQTSMLWLNECRVECASLSRVTIVDGVEHVLNSGIASVRNGPLLLAGGKTCVVSSSKALALLDATTGKHLQTRRLSSRNGRFRRMQIRGIAAPREGDAATVWVVLNTGSVQKWNLANDETAEVTMLATFDGRGFLEPMASAGRVILPNYHNLWPALLFLDEPREDQPAPLENWRAGWPTPSADGTMLAWQTNIEGLASIDLVDRHDGTLVHSIQSPVRPNSLANPQFTPDNRFMLVRSHMTSPDVLVADVGSGRWVAGLDTMNVPYAMFTAAAAERPSRIMRAGYATSFVVDVFDLDSIESSAAPRE